MVNPFSGKARIKRINGRLYDTMTPNKSFLKLAKDLKTLGIKNWYFMLEIFDVSLCNVDPHAIDERTGKTSLTRDEIERIHIECRRNPWYYLREVVRIEDPGNPNGVPYKANRGNIAQAWLFLHGIDSWLCLPRQQGKTQSILALLTWVYSYGTTNTGMIFVNKSGPDAKENLARFATTVRLLPEYMQFKWIEDDEGHRIKEKDNATERRHPVTNNRIIIKASANSLDSALKLARGLTTAIQHFDEPEFTSFIKTIIENSVSTYETAARRARENHSMYGRCFTCTPDFITRRIRRKLLWKNLFNCGDISLSFNYQIRIVIFWWPILITLGMVIRLRIETIRSQAVWFFIQKGSTTIESILI